MFIEILVLLQSCLTFQASGHLGKNTESTSEMEAFRGQSYEKDSTETMQVNVGFESWEGLKFSFMLPKCYLQYRQKPEREICMLI